MSEKIKTGMNGNRTGDHLRLNPLCYLLATADHCDTCEFLGIIQLNTSTLKPKSISNPKPNTTPGANRQNTTRMGQ